MLSSVVVPVIDVQNDNFKELWPSMVLSFKTSSFIALDTELSGLGARKALLAESVEDRYKAICQAARSRSVLSLGIACYKKLEDKAEHRYLVQVYNLTLLCAEEYIIEPQSVQFLVQHGFDFNKQYSLGVPYNKGNDKGGGVHGVNMRSLFVELLRVNRPLVVHNGLIDMIFLYQSFYAQLPDRLGTFTADLSQMFPAGIYDTKYVSEYRLRFTASYLEYVYKKCKLENSRSVEAGKTGAGLYLEFCTYTGRLQSYVDYRPCLDNQNHDSAPNICPQFSAYGWCPSGSQCCMSHDTDLIIQQDERSREDKRKKRKRRKKQKSAQVTEEEVCPQEKRAHLEEVEMQEEVQGDQVTTCKTRETEETKAEETKAEETKAEETKAEETKAEETKAEETKGDQTKRVETKREETKAEETKGDQIKREETKGKETKSETGTHRAGFDAFMTGYIFAFASIEKSEEPPEEAGISECVNKLYLSGKSIPLQVVKSTFSKSSKAHTHKMEQVWGKRSCENSSVKAE